MYYTWGLVLKVEEKKSSPLHVWVGPDDVTYGNSHGSTVKSRITSFCLVHILPPTFVVIIKYCTLKGGVGKETFYVFSFQSGI